MLILMELRNHAREIAQHAPLFNLIVQAAQLLVSKVTYANKTVRQANYL